MTHGRSSMRARVETGCALAAAAFAVLTLIAPTWIELLVGVDPDHHSGSAEASIVVVFVVISIGSALMARRDWHRSLPHVTER